MPSIDLPRDLHRRIHEAAARKGCSARKLMLEGIERAVDKVQSSRPMRAGGVLVTFDKTLAMRGAHCLLSKR